MKAFESFHPILLFVYFLATIFVSMFCFNPIVTAISFFCSVFFCGMLIGGKELAKSLAYAFVMILLISVTNPLFSHNGETMLFFLNDNPVTLEAIMYGVNVSVQIMAVIYWFKCYHAVMTSDKFIYLFGRVVPKLSLLLSMTINFIPKFKRHFAEIDEAQKALGMYATKSFVDKIRQKTRVLGILISWSLENSVQTADSMRARGYGLKGRTSYSIFRWTVRDTVTIIITLVLIAAVCYLVTVVPSYSFYPTFAPLATDAFAISLYACLFALMFLPTICEIKENLSWQYLKSKI